MFYFASKINKGSEIAYSGCWVVDESLDSAREKCVQLIQSQKWEVLQHLDELVVLRERYSEHDEGLQYYEQALTDGEVLVIYSSKQ